MSADFRPVREIWGEPCGSSLEHNEILSFLEVIADAANTACQTDEYGEKNVFTVVNGEAFVEFVEKSPEFTPEFIAGQMEEQGHSLEAERLATQVQYAKTDASNWRQNIGQAGILRFYVT